MHQQLAASEKTKALARAVMDSLVSGVGFLQNEVNLLENMKERGIGVEECSWI